MNSTKKSTKTMLPIKLICPKSKVRKDGTGVIFIQYCGPNEKKTLLNTEIAIPPKYWNRKFVRVAKELPPIYGESSSLNENLADQLKLAGDIITYALKKKVPDILDFVKRTYHPNFDLSCLESVPVTGIPVSELFYQIDDYIKCKTGKVADTTITIYRSLKAHLEAYQNYRGKEISFNDFDYNFYEGFVDFLTYEYEQKRRKTVIKGLRLASIGKTIKQLRLFIKDRIKRKIIAPIDLTDFKILEEETDAIYLTESEIRRIYQTDLSDYPQLTIYRNLFVLGCLTGLRFSDFANLKPEDIRDQSIYKKQEKSDHWVVIPLRSVAEDILNHFDCQIPAISNPEFNYQIKEVAKIAGICSLTKFSYKKGKQDIVTIKPKYGWVTSHTCRRSFCTNEFLAGTPVELIMKISGHKSLKDFYKYIRITPEEASRKIKEIWTNRGEITTVRPFSIKNITN